MGDLCYDFSVMEDFLNKKTVRDALGVGDLDFVSCSSTVYSAMMQDWMRNLEVGIPTLLEEGIKVLVYAGEEDLICNWLGKPATTQLIWNWNQNDMSKKRNYYIVLDHQVVMISVNFHIT